jgi:pyridoxamine 5'-phosphate oxidase
VHARPLLETDLDPDPLAQFKAWFAEAAAAGMRVPEAMALATAAPGAAPSVRMVLLKDATPNGFAFHTNYGSRKARELDANPQAALLFHWDPIGRQVRVEGSVERLPDAESAEYFATRPHGGQIAAWASHQSRPLASREELDAEVRRFAARYAGAEVPRPPHWGGYRLRPARYEFWQHREDRLHDRIRYERDPGHEGWRTTRLAP